MRCKQHAHAVAAPTSQTWLLRKHAQRACTAARACCRRAHTLSLDAPQAVAHARIPGSTVWLRRPRLLGGFHSHGSCLRRSRNAVPDQSLEFNTVGGCASDPFRWRSFVRARLATWRRENRGEAASQHARNSAGAGSRRGCRWRGCRWLGRAGWLRDVSALFGCVMFGVQRSIIVFSAGRCARTCTPPCGAAQVRLLASTAHGHSEQMTRLQSGWDSFGAPNAFAKQAARALEYEATR